MLLRDTDKQVRADVLGARDGESSTWDRLFNAHHPPLYRFFASRVQSSADAEDLASDTFLQAWRSRGDLEWRERPFDSWLFGIARHRLAGYYRDCSRDRTIPLDMDANECARRPTELDTVELYDLLERAPAADRVAIQLRFIWGLNSREAATVMRRSAGAYRTLLHRALRRIDCPEDAVAPGARDS